VLSETTDSTARGIQLLSICLFLLTQAVTTTRKSTPATVRDRDSRLRNQDSNLVKVLKVAVPMDSVARSARWRTNQSVLRQVRRGPQETEEKPGGQSGHKHAALRALLMEVQGKVSTSSGVVQARFLKA
jgi:cobalamin biosynthesis Mg chelatase CobN